MTGYRKLIAIGLGVIGNVAMAIAQVDPAVIEQVSQIIGATLAVFIAGNLAEHKINKPKEEKPTA